MSIHDIFAQAEESVSRETYKFGKKQDVLINVYTLKLSNSDNVIRQCFDWIIKDCKRSKRKFIIIFNVKHVESKTTQLMGLDKLLRTYQSLLFSSRLYKFGILVKDFAAHRRVIGVFDKVFDEAKQKRKYTYFQVKEKDKLLEWLVRL